MHKINDIISMPVISLYEGELIGQVSKIYLDKKLKKITCFVVSCEGDLTYLLFPKSIYRLGKNAITIKNLSCLILEIDNDIQDMVLMPINSKVYTIQGEYVGKIAEITVDNKFDVNNILMENNNFIDLNLIASCSKNTVVINDNNTKINVTKFKNKITQSIFKSKEKSNIVNTMPHPPVIENFNNSITLPANVTNNPNFLVGRIAIKDLYLDDKKILIKENSTITEKTLQIATIHNKIKELMLNSKQK